MTDMTQRLPKVVFEPIDTDEPRCPDHYEYTHDPEAAFGEDGFCVACYGEAMSERNWDRQPWD